MRISLIVAMDRNGLIGNETGLPWHLSADLRRFRKLTTGHPIIMGRKTFEHIGAPLKERLNIVMTRRTDCQSLLQGCVVAHSLDEAMQIARDAKPPMRTDEVFIIGGAEIFRQAMPLIDRVYLTIVEAAFSGNTWFPFDERFRGTIIHDESLLADEKNAHAHRFVILDRADTGTTIQELLHLVVFIRHERFAAKIAYACIFATSVEEASQNLVRLIANRDCGFDEGTTAWCDVLADYLQAFDALRELNRFGANFSVTQWSLILQQVRTALLARATAVG